MWLKRDRDLRPLFRGILTAFLAIAAGASSQAQQFNYNWGVPYGSNYNYGYMRYNQGGFSGMPSGATMQPQFNPGMPPAGYDQVYGQAAAGVPQAADPFNSQAATQALQNQQQMQAMELRFDVRKRTPRTMQAKERQASKPLTRSQVLSSDGKVLWPVRAPGEGELGKSRAAAEAAIQVAYKEFQADGKTSVKNLVEAKEQLYSYGHPALDKAAKQSRQAAQGLHHFLYSLERVLDSLGGV